MKKLSLKALELGAKEILTREQLKYVLGGFNATAENVCSTGCRVFTTWQQCISSGAGGTTCYCPAGTYIPCYI